MAKASTAALAPALSGRLGNAVFVQTPHGTVVRQLPARPQAVSMAQSLARMRLSRASATFRAMSLAQAQAWKTYAQSLNADLPQSRIRGGISAQQAFNALTTKLLQIDPNATIPLLPPAEPFGGDALTFQIQPIPGAIRFTADRSNASGVTTELLIQRLPSVHCRTYLTKYRTAAFAAFSGDLEYDLPCQPGVWAVAVRFVRVATGQATGVYELGTVDVEE